MDLDSFSEGLRAWLETLKEWLLQQPWPAPVHDWIAKAGILTIWAILVGALAILILIIGFLWPVRKPKS